VESNIWNSIIFKLPNPHFLQTHEWGQGEGEVWLAAYLHCMEYGREDEKERDLSSFDFHPSAACLILKKTIPMGGMSARLSILYAPKGPLLDWTNEPLRKRVLNDLQTFARKQGAIFLKMDPDVVLGTGVPSSQEDLIDQQGSW